MTELHDYGELNVADESQINFGLFLISLKTIQVRINAIIHVCNSHVIPEGRFYSTLPHPWTRSSQLKVQNE